MRTVTVPRFDARLRWSGVLAVAATVFVASVVVDPGGGPRGAVGPWWDELAHLLAYATLALALAYATADWTHTTRRVAAVLAVAVGYGVLIELVQIPVPYRQFGTTDLVANAAGALLGSGWIACERWIRYRPRDADG